MTRGPESPRGRGRRATLAVAAVLALATILPVPAFLGCGGATSVLENGGFEQVVPAKSPYGCCEVDRVPAPH